MRNLSLVNMTLCAALVSGGCTSRHPITSFPSSLVGETVKIELYNQRTISGKARFSASKPGSPQRVMWTDEDGRLIELRFIRSVSDISHGGGAWDGFWLGLLVGLVSGPIIGDKLIDPGDPDDPGDSLRSTFGGLMISVSTAFISSLSGLVIGAIRGSRDVYEVPKEYRQMLPNAATSATRSGASIVSVTPLDQGAAVGVKFTF